MRKTPSTSTADGQLWLARVVGSMQYIIGAFGAAGLIAYALDTPDNPSRYQFLLAPIGMWLLALPLLIFSMFIYHKTRPTMSTIDKWIFNFCVGVPWFVLARIFAMPFILK